MESERLSDFLFQSNQFFNKRKDGILQRRVFGAENGFESLKFVESCLCIVEIRKGENGGMFCLNNGPERPQKMRCEDKLHDFVVNGITLGLADDNRSRRGRVLLENELFVRLQITMKETFESWWRREMVESDTEP